MKHLTAVALTFMFSLPALADPPTLDSLKGTWWDEEGAVMLEIGADGAGTVLDCSSQGSKAGQFSIDAAGKLSFAPQGSPSSEWTASMDGDFLLLTSGKDTKQRCRRETREEREKRFVQDFAELNELSMSLKTPSMEAGAANRARKRAEELMAELKVLLPSLAGADGKAQEAAMERMLAKHAPALMKELEAAKAAARASARTTACRNNLKQIGVYFALYESKHRAWPRDLDAIKSKDLATDEKLFRCPASGLDDAYDYVFPEKGDETPTDAVMGFDRDAHPDGSRCVLSFAGAVQEMDQADFDRARKEGMNAVKPLIVITAAKVTDGEVVVEGTVANLRSAKEGGPKGVRARVSLRIYGRTKAPQVSETQALSGDGSGPLEFTLRWKPGSEALNAGSLVIEVVDEVRDERFVQDVELKK